MGAYENKCQYSLVLQAHCNIFSPFIYSARCCHHHGQQCSVKQGCSVIQGAAKVFYSFKTENTKQYNMLSICNFVIENDYLLPQKFYQLLRLNLFGIMNT